MFPSEEFCPPPPNPEDIIYDVDETPSERPGLDNPPEGTPETSPEKGSEETEGPPDE